MAQPEASIERSTTYEVSPTFTGQPVSKFQYIGPDGTGTTGFTNNVGAESSHADSVGNLFYGDTNTAKPEGVAPGVSEIYNYEADYFVNTIVSSTIAINARIVNQSFIATPSPPDTQAQMSSRMIITPPPTTRSLSPGWEMAAAFLPRVPATMGSASPLTVALPASAPPTMAALSRTSPRQPGRPAFRPPRSPAPQPCSSRPPFAATPGLGTANDASDSRVLKALLLNGAVKPSDWTHTATAPLDTRYGAGILNVYNSYTNLRAGEYGNSGTTSGPVTSINTGPMVPANEGWDFATITTLPLLSGTYVAQSNHYLFDLTSATAPEFTLTSTLTWWRQVGQTAINNLDLYLFDATTGTQIALSDSTVDNVQQLFVQDLSPGEYDLVVHKDGGASVSGSGGTVVSADETYALAFNFASVPEPSASGCSFPAFPRWPSSPAASCGPPKRSRIELGWAGPEPAKPVWLGRGCLPQRQPQPFSRPPFPVSGRYLTPPHVTKRFLLPPSAPPRKSVGLHARLLSRYPQPLHLGNHARLRHALVWLRLRHGLLRRLPRLLLALAPPVLGASPGKGGRFYYLGRSLRRPARRPPGQLHLYGGCERTPRPLLFFRVWEGGMASHGGILGLLLFTWWYARRHHLSWTSIGDNLCVVAPIGLFFGRLANFINGELYGRAARGVSWAVQFPKELYDDPALAARAGAALAHDPAVSAYAGKATLMEAIVAASRSDEHVRQILRTILTPRYPSQLIEAALEGVVLFCALWALRTLVKVPRGVITGAFFILYALLRIAGEQFRQPGSDSPFAFVFGFLTYGQLLSIFLIFIGIAFVAWGFRARQYEQAFRP